MTHLTQAIVEARAMFEDLASSKTLADLDQLYVNWIGYSIVEDEPSVSFECVRGDLLDYIKEFCVDTDTPCGVVSPELAAEVGHG